MTSKDLAVRGSLILMIRPKTRPNLPPDTVLPHLIFSLPLLYFTVKSLHRSDFQPYLISPSSFHFLTLTLFHPHSMKPMFHPALFTITPFTLTLFTTLWPYFTLNFPFLHPYFISTPPDFHPHAIYTILFTVSLCHFCSILPSPHCHPHFINPFLLDPFHPYLISSFTLFYPHFHPHNISP